MRGLHLLFSALFGQFLFASCTTVRRDDHSYTYVYQHNAQTQTVAPSPVRDHTPAPLERPSLALEADPEPVTADEPERTYSAARDPVYIAAPVREYAPVQNVAYAPSGPGPFYEPPTSVYYRLPPEPCIKPAYRVPSSTGPLSFGLFFRTGTGGASGGECRRPVNPHGGSVYYSGPPSSPSVRGGHAKGR